MKKPRLLLIVIIFILMITIPSFVYADKEKVDRYNILVLDTSGSSDFLSNGKHLYTADTAIDYVKNAANQFVSDLVNAGGNNKIALITYNSSANVLFHFSNDVEEIASIINGLTAGAKNSTNLTSGLQKANELLDEIKDVDAIKNVVVFTTGFTNTGLHDYNGHYGKGTIASDWHNVATNIHLYAYANVAYREAESIKDKAKLYSVGLFQNLNAIPIEGKNILNFFKLFTKELASSSNDFYNVDDPKNLKFIFGEVAEDIVLVDTDGDGIPDEWEKNGVDTNGDGKIDLLLHLMGADPNVPDIFIEVDWMEKALTQLKYSEDTEWVTVNQPIILKPYENAMKKVYESFKAKGINLHIDAGPDSTDFVTGKKWGKLSGGNSIPWMDLLKFDKETCKEWMKIVDANFSDGRRNAFRHALFLNRYDYGKGEDSTGLATIGDQFFIIADCDGSLNKKLGGNALAGTFMHELGHTLGLRHGGQDELNRKPNYLSIMNYMFQLTGLVGTNDIDYSSFVLPVIDEESILETYGIDPDGITKEMGLGTKIALKCDGHDCIYKTINKISKKMLDFNDDLFFNPRPYECDVNKDGEISLLFGSNDWNNLEIKVGNIGKTKQLILVDGIELTQEQIESLYEPPKDYFVKHGLLGNEGAGSIEDLGPYTLIENKPNQKLFLRVNNLSTIESTFKIEIDSNPITNDFSKTISVPGSEGEIKYMDIAIPVTDKPEVGDYSLIARLISEGRENIEIEVPVNVYNPTVKELNALKEAIDNGALDGKIYDDSIKMYSDILKDKVDDSNTDIPQDNVVIDDPTTNIPKESTVIERVAGKNRYETAVKISSKSYDSSDTVILASGHNFADALAGSSLAGQVKAPILLTPVNELPKLVKDEIVRLKSRKVIILGGVNSISESVEKALSNYEVERIAGDNRYETALKISDKLPSNKAILASGEDFADALSIAAHAYKNNIPILLTPKSSLPNGVYDKLEKTETIVVGGNMRIPDEIIKELPSAKRISGENRYETSFAVYKEFSSNSVNVVLASGESFPDALAGAPFASINDTTVLLTGKLTLPKSYSNLKKDAEKIWILGGKNTISNSLEKALK